MKNQARQLKKVIKERMKKQLGSDYVAIHRNTAKKIVTVLTKVSKKRS